MSRFQETLTEHEAASLSDTDLMSYAQGQQVEGWFMHMFYQRHGGLGIALSDNDRYRNARTKRAVRAECMSQLRMQGRIVNEGWEDNLVILLLD